MSNEKQAGLTAVQILDQECNKYGGFVNVITKCGGTLVSQVWLRTMQEYSAHLIKERDELKELLKQAHKYTPYKLYEDITVALENYNQK